MEETNAPTTRNLGVHFIKTISGYDIVADVFSDPNTPTEITIYNPVSAYEVAPEMAQALGFQTSPENIMLAFSHLIPRSFVTEPLYKLRKDHILVMTPGNDFLRNHYMEYLKQSENKLLAKKQNDVSTKKVHYN